MKLNSKRLLLWLFDSDPSQERSCSAQQMSWLMPDLTPGGQRSLIALLKKNQLLISDGVRGKRRLRITSYGRSSLISSFPALNPSHTDWNGQWSLMVFLQAPSSDHQFRYLRSVLVEANAGQLSRGVYLFPGDFPSHLLDLCDRLYRGGVSIFTIEKWNFGDERSVIVPLFSLSDVAESLSGISSEVKSLLIKKGMGNATVDQSKMLILGIMDRYINSLEHDVGIVTHYFSRVSTAIELLSQIQQLH